MVDRGRCGGGGGRIRRKKKKRKKRIVERRKERERERIVDEISKTTVEVFSYLLALSG